MSLCAVHTPLRTLCMPLPLPWNESDDGSLAAGRFATAGHRERGSVESQHEVHHGTDIIDDPLTSSATNCGRGGTVTNRGQNPKSETSPLLHGHVVQTPLQVLLWRNDVGRDASVIFLSAVIRNIPSLDHFEGQCKCVRPAKTPRVPLLKQRKLTALIICQINALRMQ